jgi:mannose-1-phosphate guanylyltransferase
MKVIIYAGGHGLRMWPISRKNSPKQFEQMFNGRSTLQMMVERVEEIVGIENIFISTNNSFKELIKKQIPKLPKENVIYEPAKRDLAPAVGLSMMKFNKLGIDEPVAILWSDHLIKDNPEFQKALKVGEKLIIENPNRFVFTGEIPRFANNNIGWINIGGVLKNVDGLDVYNFEGWTYRPAIELCNCLFDSGKAIWNTGYFVTSVKFVIDRYKQHLPEMAEKLEEIIENPELMDEIYPTLESISFDDGIVVKTNKNQAVVLKVDMGWSDPGSLYALKEALVSNTDDNFVKGRAITLDNKDSMVYNQNDAQLVTTIGLDGFVVVNTGDTILVCHKDRIQDIKELLKMVEEEGYDEYL